MACFNCTHALSNKEGSFKETYMLQIIETPYRVYLLPYYTASPIIKTRAKAFMIKYCYNFFSSTLWNSYDFDNYKVFVSALGIYIELDCL